MAIKEKSGQLAMTQGHNLLLHPLRLPSVSIWPIDSSSVASPHPVAVFGHQFFAYDHRDALVSHWPGTPAMALT